MQPVLGKGEAERLRHLALGLAPGPCVGQGEGQGDAVGGVEQVAFPLGQRAVQVEGEGRVASRKFAQFRPGRARR